MSTKVLVFGTGGVGCIYAAIVDKGGAAVTAVCRSNYNAVKANGILVRSALWGHIRTKPNTVQSAADAIAYGPFDFIIVASKAFPGTAELITAAVTPGKTAIVLAQNGIDIELAYREAYPDNTIISGCVYLPTTQVELGVVEHGPLERFEIGTYPADASQDAKNQAKCFADLFAAGGATAALYDDIQERRWNKLSINACLNPITALTMCDDANFLRSSAYAGDLAKNVMKEIGTLAAAAGYPNAVTDDIIEYHMTRWIGRLDTGGKEPSMLVDIQNNRPIEVEAILGNALRKAETLGLRMPQLKMLYVLAKARDFSTLKNEEWKPIASYD